MEHLLFKGKGKVQEMMIVLSLTLPSGRWKMSFAVDFLSSWITDTFKCEKNSPGFSSLS